MITDLDKLIVRTWSARTSRDLDAPPEVIADLIACDVEGVAKRMAALRACGQLPWPEVEGVA